MEERKHAGMVLKLNWKMLIYYFVLKAVYISRSGIKVVLSAVCRAQLPDTCTHVWCVYTCQHSIIKLEMCWRHSVDQDGRESHRDLPALHSCATRLSTSTAAGHCCMNSSQNKLSSKSWAMTRHALNVKRFIIFQSHQCSFSKKLTMKSISIDFPP